MEKADTAYRADKRAEGDRIHSKAIDIYQRAVVLENDMKNKRMKNQREFHVTKEMTKIIK